MDEIAAAVARLDRKNWLEIEEVWNDVRPYGDALPPYLRAAYPDFRHGEGRTTLVSQATKFARWSEDAFQLGLTALADKSKRARYRACGVLAYALRKEAIPALKAMRDDPDWQVRQSAKAAIFAIREGNHHLFFDRDGSGFGFWEVNPDDKPGKRVSWLTRLRMRMEIEHRLE